MQKITMNPRLLKQASDNTYILHTTHLVIVIYSRTSGTMLTELLLSTYPPKIV